MCQLDLNVHRSPSRVWNTRDKDLSNTYFFLSKTVPKEAPAPTCHLENENLEEFLFLSPRSIITLSVKRRSVGECSSEHSKSLGECSWECLWMQQMLIPHWIEDWDFKWERGTQGLSCLLLQQTTVFKNTE